jgi:hypothetical protein
MVCRPVGVAVKFRFLFLLACLVAAFASASAMLLVVAGGGGETFPSFESLVRLYRFSDGGEGVDEVGGIDGVFAGTATTDAEAYYNPTYASGAGAYFYSSAIASAAAGNPTTISLWIKPTHSDTGKRYYGILGQGAGHPGNTLDLFKRYNNLYMNWSSSAPTYLSSASVNNWTHLMISYGGVSSSVNVYRNGALIRTFTASAIVANGTFYVGRRRTYSAYDERRYIGYIDGVAVYEAALGEAEAIALYNSRPDLLP